MITCYINFLDKDAKGNRKRAAVFWTLSRVPCKGEHICSQYETTIYEVAMVCHTANCEGSVVASVHVTETPQ